MDVDILRAKSNGHGAVAVKIGYDPVSNQITIGIIEGNPTVRIEIPYRKEDGVLVFGAHKAAEGVCTITAYPDGTLGPLQVVLDNPGDDLFRRCASLVVSEPGEDKRFGRVTVVDGHGDWTQIHKLIPFGSA